MRFFRTIILILGLITLALGIVASQATSYRDHIIAYVIGLAPGMSLFLSWFIAKRHYSTKGW